jgi:hypothetical protein
LTDPNTHTTNRDEKQQALTAQGRDDDASTC